LKLVPKLLSNTNNNEAANKTGNDNTPSIAVMKNAQIVKGRRVIIMPFVLKFKTVVI
jgi:hypothetical protein